MFGIKSRKEKIEFALLILGIIGIIIFKVFDNKSNREILHNQGYTIGILTQIHKSKSFVSWVPNSYQLTINTPTIKFTYCVKDSTFKGNYGTDTFPINEELAVVGKAYFVVYSKKNPNTARILLDYAVRDSAEFKKTVNAFTLNPDRFKFKL